MKQVDANYDELVLVILIFLCCTMGVVLGTLLFSVYERGIEIKHKTPQIEEVFPELTTLDETVFL
jgi:hypothetical protein